MKIERQQRHRRSDVVIWLEMTDARDITTWKFTLPGIPLPWAVFTFTSSTLKKMDFLLLFLKLLAWFHWCFNSRCLITLCFNSQPTRAVADIRNHLWWASDGELRRYGVLDHHSLPDAALCYHINCLFPMEDEQGARTHNVSIVFRVRRRFTLIRIRRF